MSRELLPSIGIRKLDGVAVSMAKTPDGGFETVGWNGKEWVPMGDSIEEVALAVGASDAFLKSVGLPVANS